MITERHSAIQRGAGPAWQQASESPGKRSRYKFAARAFPGRGHEKATAGAGSAGVPCPETEAPTGGKAPALRRKSACTRLTRRDNGRGKPYHYRWLSWGLTVSGQHSRGVCRSPLEHLLGKRHEQLLYRESSAGSLSGTDLVIVTASAESRVARGPGQGDGQGSLAAARHGFFRHVGHADPRRLRHGRTDLVIVVPFKIWGFNPDDGKLRWQCEGLSSDSICSSAIAHDGIVYALETGPRGGGTMAVRAGGEGDVTKTNVLWRGKERSRIGTPRGRMAASTGSAAASPTALTRRRASKSTRSVSAALAVPGPRAGGTQARRTKTGPGTKTGSPAGWHGRNRVEKVNEHATSAAHPGGLCQPSSGREFRSWESKGALAWSKLLMA